MSPADLRRRWLGVCCLALSAGLLLCGQTLLRPHLDGLAFAIYWLACFGFTFLTLVLALLDVRAVRRRILAEHRQQQAELLQRTVADVERLRKGRPEGRDDPDSHRQSP